MHPAHGRVALNVRSIVFDVYTVGDMNADGALILAVAKPMAMVVKRMTFVLIVVDNISSLIVRY